MPRRRLDTDTRLVDNRVARDGVEPGRAGASVRPVGRRGAPDRGEGLLGRVLGASAIAKPPDCQSKHRSREAPVELLERLAVTLAGALDQIAVASHASGVRRAGGG